MMLANNSLTRTRDFLGWHWGCKPLDSQSIMGLKTCKISEALYHHEFPTNNKWKSSFPWFCLCNPLCFPTCSTINGSNKWAGGRRHAKGLRSPAMASNSQPKKSEEKNDYPLEKRSHVPPNGKFGTSSTQRCRFFLDMLGFLLLMAEIPNNHLGCMKPYKEWDKLPINWSRISSIHSRKVDEGFVLKWSVCHSYPLMSFEIWWVEG